MLLAAEHNEKWGYTWISYEVLAGHAEMSKRNLRRHLKNLETDGFIEIHRGGHHTATKFRLRMDLPPVVIPRPPRVSRRKISPFQRPLEPGSQDDLRGVVAVTPEEELEGTSVSPQNSFRGDNGGHSEGTTEVISGGTTEVIRGDNGGHESCSNHAHQPGINRVYVTPVEVLQNLKRDEKRDIKPLPQPGENGCPQPGGNGGSSCGQNASIFPGLTAKGVPETKSENMGPSPPNPYLEYQRNIGPLAPILEERIRAAEERYGAVSIVEAIGIAVEQNSRKWSYVEGILRKWASEGRGAPGESPGQRNNRKKYLEEYVRIRGHLPWEHPTAEDYQEDVDREQGRRRAPPPEVDPAADNHWHIVLDALRQKVDKPTFETWLAATYGVSCDDQRFVVDVPTPFAIAWLERRMYQDIQKAVQQVTGKLLDVQFQCSS